MSLDAQFSVFHGLVGMAATLLAILLGLPPTVTAVAIFLLGVAHEVYDGDLWRKADGAPYEGVKDVLSFLPGPFLYALAHEVAR
ncbi:MAG TPA: hypothetical protein VEU74_12095 [Gemmatimonadales bacterium]|nr:hypothetical protein [Gemmatimonadales bacterium]